MAHPNSSNFMSPESSSCSGIKSASANANPSQASVQQSQILSGPLGILWDMENCPVPSDVRPEDVAGNIRMALRVHPVISGAVTLFSAYGDFNAFPRRLREGCQKTGVKLVDVPNGRKDAADKAILVDMFLFALDNPPPSSILLISGDVDFAPALHILGQRGYTIILVIPAGVGVSSALSNAGRFVWDWPSVARGEGFVPPKSFMFRGSDPSGFLMVCSHGEIRDGQNEEEAIVYAGTSHGEYSSRFSVKPRRSFESSHISRDPSRGFHSMSDYSNNNLNVGPSIHSSRSHSLPAVSRDIPLAEQSRVQEQTLWVQPGDIQGLKGQLVRLLEMSGGSLPLVRLPNEYLKEYGRPLYVSEYGVCKLVNLIKKMGSSLYVEGRGHCKVLHLGNSLNRNERLSMCAPENLAIKDSKGKGLPEDSIDIGICPNMGSSSDDFSDDDKAEVMGEGRYSDSLHSFRQEMQELLVCYSCRVLLSSFEALYEQRYKKPLEYQNFGVNGLEELIEKVSDVVTLLEEQGSKRKFLVSSYVST